MNELKRCLKLSNDRINQLEQINQILMEKLAETVDKNIDLESKCSKLMMPSGGTSKVKSTVTVPVPVSASTASSNNTNQPNHTNNNITSSVQCTKI